VEESALKLALHEAGYVAEAGLVTTLWFAQALERPVLLEGDHQRISRWRRQQALARTVRRRPDLLARAKQVGLDVDTLSMGMSADLETAIAEGATLVRVGTAIFGVRQYAKEETT